MMNKDVASDINQFAAAVAKLRGYQYAHGYDFESSLDMIARQCWEIAKASHNFWSLKFVPKLKS